MQTTGRWASRPAEACSCGRVSSASGGSACRGGSTPPPSASAMSQLASISATAPDASEGSSSSPPWTSHGVQVGSRLDREQPHPPPRRRTEKRNAPEAAIAGRCPLICERPPLVVRKISAAGTRHTRAARCSRSCNGSFGRARRVPALPGSRSSRGGAQRPGRRAADVRAGRMRARTGLGPSSTSCWCAVPVSEAPVARPWRMAPFAAAVGLGTLRNTVY
eukprot:scaffold5064_cov115-Isochrysis_galbana.AAC.20